MRSKVKFFKYYRKLGVNHFIFVDNGSDDGCMTVLDKCEDVTVFYTESSYKKSNFGMHWLNFLLIIYGTDKWCLICDPDEFLVYPHMDTRSLNDLVEMLDRNGRKAFFTLMLDMYGKGDIDTNEYVEGENPVEFCPYFDKKGYYSRVGDRYQNLWAQGGVRSRVFSKNHPKSAPAINKTPLVKWKWNYSYISSMHMLIPGYLNRFYREDKASVTGCLLHFKFISLLKQKVEEEIQRKEHYNDSAEYKLYQKSLNESEDLFDPNISIKYENWKQLAELGLLRDGSWG